VTEKLTTEKTWSKRENAFKRWFNNV